MFTKSINSNMGLCILYASAALLSCLGSEKVWWNIWRQYSNNRYSWEEKSKLNYFSPYWSRMNLSSCTGTPHVRSRMPCRHGQTNSHHLIYEWQIDKLILFSNICFRESGTDALSAYNHHSDQNLSIQCVCSVCVYAHVCACMHTYTSVYVRAC